MNSILSYASKSCLSALWSLTLPIHAPFEKTFTAFFTKFSIYYSDRVARGIDKDRNFTEISNSKGKQAIESFIESLNRAEIPKDSITIKEFKGEDQAAFMGSIRNGKKAVLGMSADLIERLAKNPLNGEALFSVAHELGHLVYDHHGEIRIQNAETVAYLALRCYCVAFLVTWASGKAISSFLPLSDSYLLGLAHLAGVGIAHKYAKQASIQCAYETEFQADRFAASLSTKIKEAGIKYFKYKQVEMLYAVDMLKRDVQEGTVPAWTARWTMSFINDKGDVISDTHPLFSDRIEALKQLS